MGDFEARDKKDLSGGFALPSVLIASVVMLMVLLIGIQNAISIRVALADRYYSRLADEATESGVAMAKACLDTNGAVTWSNAQPLTSGTDCNGVVRSECSGATPANSCYVLKTTNLRSSFSVPNPAIPSPGVYNIVVSTTVDQLRTSSGAVWNTYTSDVKVLVASEPSTWRQISSNYLHTCAVSMDYRAYCSGWKYGGVLGDGYDSASPVPLSLTTAGVLSGKTIKAVATGGAHGCAIASDDKAYCWGNNNPVWLGFGQLGNGTNTHSSVPVAVSQGAMPAGATIKAISAGSMHTCAIASDNKAYCWGINRYGQLGDSSTNYSQTPVAVSQGAMPAGATIKAISASAEQTCAIASDDKAYCWGLNTYGQLGNGTSGNSSSTPVAVSQGAMPAGWTVKVITTGWYHTCAIASDNKVYCWGNNGVGQLGDNTLVDKLTPVKLNEPLLKGPFTYLKVEAGYGHTCGVRTNNTVNCWGENANGQIGNNSTTDVKIPTAITAISGKTIVDITAGDRHNCVVTNDSLVYCWGMNNYGQVGDGVTTDEKVATAVTTAGVLNGKTIVALGDAANSHTCVVASDNQAHCWGYNGDSALGNGSLTETLDPKAVDTSAASGLNGKTVKYIDTGYQHTCAIASDDKVYCWGRNGVGQLGNNTTTDSSLPVAVDTSAASGLNGKTVKKLSVGPFSTCVIASDDKAYCWGWNQYGQLGTGNTTTSLLPVAVDSSITSGLNGLSVVSIKVGYLHGCAIANNSKAYCWGENGSGELGTNDTVDYLSPKAVDTGGTSGFNGKNVKDITVGYAHTCGIASDDKAYCWGWGWYGPLGNSSSIDRVVPTAVTTSGALLGTTIKAISGGYLHTCAIASNDKPYCWGWNAQGQLGDSSTTASLAPVAVTTTGVLSGKTVKSITSGYFFQTCSIASDNKGYCWGYNNYGQFANSTTTSSTSPVAAFRPSGTGYEFQIY